MGEVSTNNNLQLPLPSFSWLLHLPEYLLILPRDCLLTWSIFSFLILSKISIYFVTLTDNGWSYVLVFEQCRLVTYCIGTTASYWSNEMKLIKILEKEWTMLPYHIANCNHCSMNVYQPRSAWMANLIYSKGQKKLTTVRALPKNAPTISFSLTCPDTVLNEKDRPVSMMRRWRSSISQNVYRTVKAVRILCMHG